jgi:hypothetical protein
MIFFHCFREKFFKTKNSLVSSSKLSNHLIINILKLYQKFYKKLIQTKTHFFESNKNLRKTT